MDDSPVSSSASASSAGTVYQFYIALAKCFEMLSAQRVLIEILGDVTVYGREQFEIKCYSDPLTDNHINFWKTLCNWMDSSFDESGYSSLVLVTTQSYGSKTKLAEWNEASVNRRISILEEIKSDSESRFIASGEKEPSQSLIKQRKLFSCDPDKLKRVIGKVFIDANSPSLSNLLEEIKQKNLKGILVRKKDDFVNSLMGFLVSPAIIVDNKWEITYENFEEKVRTLTSTYCRDTRIFPRKYFDLLPQQDKVESCKEKLFVKKINEIEYHEVVPEAINNYISTTNTILNEFKNYDIKPSRYDVYEEEVLKNFTARYRFKARNVSDVIRDSKNFYDEVLLNTQISFTGFTDIPSGFCNGVIHINCDDAEKNMKWRLE